MKGIKSTGVNDGWCVYASEIFADASLILDRKRHCQKYRNTVTEIKSLHHFRMGDVLDFASSQFKNKPSKLYRYVDNKSMRISALTNGQIIAAGIFPVGQSSSRSLEIFLLRVFGLALVNSLLLALTHPMALSSSFLWSLNRISTRSCCHALRTRHSAQRLRHRY